MSKALAAIRTQVAVVGGFGQGSWRWRNAEGGPDHIAPENADSWEIDEWQMQQVRRSLGVSRKDSWHWSINARRILHEAKGWFNKERVFAEEWAKENAYSPGYNFGHGILQDLLFENVGGFDRGRAHFVISRRDAAIVATVVQWFGTNCGWCWLESTVRKCGYKLVPLDALEKMDVRRREMQSASRRNLEHAERLHSDIEELSRELAERLAALRRASI